MKKKKTFYNLIRTKRHKNNNFELLKIVAIAPLLTNSNSSLLHRGWQYFAACKNITLFGTGYSRLMFCILNCRWDNRVSTAIPDEGIFYTLGLLYASELNAYQVYDDQNQAILDYCNKVGIRVKQYLGSHPTKRSWIDHFGQKWPSFLLKKDRYDPKMILSPGQRIFNNN